MLDVDASIMYYFNNVIKPSVTRNGKRVNVSSYLLKDTDQVEVNEKSNPNQEIGFPSSGLSDRNIRLDWYFLIQIIKSESEDSFKLWGCISVTIMY